MNHSSLAAENFKRGYNCAQAVLLAFGDLTGLDEKTAAKLSSGFGGGMGRLREVCGAVSGMFMITGLLYGFASPTDREAKKTLYEDVQSLAFAFKEKNGSYVCRELLVLSQKTADSPTPEPRTQAYYQKRPCKELVGDAAEILERFIAEHS